MRQKIVRRFQFGMIEGDCENMAVAMAQNPRITDETALLRIALENMANNSGSPQVVNILRKTYRKNMEKAEAQS